jgi:hypothetical protein
MPTRQKPPENDALYWNACFALAAKRRGEVAVLLRRLRSDLPPEVARRWLHRLLDTRLGPSV